MPQGKALATAGASSSKAEAAAEEEDDDEIDLFGEDDEEEDAEAERIKAERVAKYQEAKAAKTAEKLAAGKTLDAAKSVVTLQVKPWDDETDMAELEKGVRAIEKDGLVWGKSQLVPVGYGELNRFSRKVSCSWTCRYQDAANQLGHRGRQDLPLGTRGGDPGRRGPRSVYRHCW